MTRINVVPPIDLTDQHLIAEYRELPMVMKALERTLASKKGLRLNEIPQQYTLNEGHVRFFYNKGQYLIERYQLLMDEMVRRGFKPGPRNTSFKVFEDNPQLMTPDSGQWVPTDEDKAVNIERLVERIDQKQGFYRYMGLDLALWQNGVLSYWPPKPIKQSPNLPTPDVDLPAVESTAAQTPVEAPIRPTAEYIYMSLNAFRRAYPGISPLGAGWEIVDADTIRKLA